MPAARDALDRFARHYLAALRLETVLRPGVEPVAATPQAEAHVAGVGWLVGILGCLTFAIVAVLLRGNPFGPAVAAAIACIATALLTGARHEVALQHALQPAGAASIALLLVARALLLAAVGAASEPAVLGTLFAGPVVSRFFAQAMAHRTDAAAPPGALRLPALWCVVPLLLLVPAGGVRLLVLALIGSALFAFAARRLLAALAGKPLAQALQPACELGFYLGAAIAA